MSPAPVELIATCARAQRYRITFHAREEMAEDDVTTSALLNTLEKGRIEIIEDYPEDRRGHSWLLLCELENGEPLHVCCAIHEDTLVVITVYRPDPDRWSKDWRFRK